jgi:4-hydroxy-tetrahydrodipicolinate synthase
MPLFRGAGTALVTPMTDAGVDFDALGRLIDFQLDRGIDALVACGTTGEPATLTEKEYEDVVKFTIEKAAKRVPVVAGAGSNNTLHAVELAKKAEGLGADGILAVTPYYNKTTQAGLVAHFRAIADAVHSPVILYNVPPRTGLNMKAETVAKLAGYPNIHGVKEASGDLSQIIDIARFCAGKLALWSGEDGIILPILACGGDGVISVVSNVAPRQTHELCRKFFEGDIEGAKALQFELKPLIDALFTETSPIPAKAALELMGICKPTVRLPLVPIGAEALARLKAAMAAMRLIP